MPACPHYPHTHCAQAHIHTPLYKDDGAWKNHSDAETVEFPCWQPCVALLMGRWEGNQALNEFWQSCSLCLDLVLRICSWFCSFEGVQTCRRLQRTVTRQRVTVRHQEPGSRCPCLHSRGVGGGEWGHRGTDTCRRKCLFLVTVCSLDKLIAAYAPLPLDLALAWHRDYFYLLTSLLFSRY